MNRSEIMRRVHSSDTKPEMLVRRHLHSMGYRYRLHDKTLPGKPDIVFRNRRRVIFVHGCFWHGHDCARGARLPASNRDYWKAKIHRNSERDALNLRALTADGWRALVIWECELRDQEQLRARLKSFMESPQDSSNE